MAKRLQSAESSVPDGVIQRHIRAISAAKEQMQEATAKYRAALKLAKSDGVNQGSLIAAMNEAKRDVEQVKIDTRDRLRYLALLNMPLTQMELFPASEQPAAEEAEPTLVDGEPTDHQLWEATEAGKKAGSTGGDVTANPHEHPALSAAWARGFKAGLKKIADQMGPGATMAPTRKRRERAEPLRADA